MSSATRTAYSKLVDALRGAGKEVNDAGDRAMAQCPAHPDERPSLSIGPRRDGKGVVVYCHASCSTPDVLKAAGMSMRDLFDDNAMRDVYAPTRDYRYPGGRVVHRKADKSFRQSGKKVDRSLYGSDKITDATTTVYFVEGEKDCEAVEAAGGVAVCSAMGAGKAHLADMTPLRDLDVVIVADKDKAGRAHARNVLVLLDGIAASARIVEAKAGKDFADHFAAGYGLDELVRARAGSTRKASGQSGSTGSDGSSTGGSDEPVLDQIRSWLQRFICPMEPRDLDLLTLWIAHTHLVDETYTTPRLLIESPVPESGKTTVLEHLERFCVDPIQMATVSSPAMITRVLDNGIHTLLIDEADRSLNPEKPGIDDLIAVLNSGYKKGATRPVLVPIKGGGWDTAMMPTFAPVAMAGNQPRLPDDTLSRVIRVLIMPDHEGTVEDSDWELIEDEAQEIAGQLAMWAEQVRDQVRTGERPPLPDGARARTKERWLPLKRVAVAAAGRWPAVVDQLVGLDLERMRLDREEGIINEKTHVVLLRNLAEVWPAGETFIATDDLITMLTDRFPSSWGSSDRYPNGLTAQRFGRMLVKNYGVYSDRISTTKVRGYAARAFDSALRSVRLPPLSEPSEPAKPTPPADIGGEPANGELFTEPPADNEPPQCGCGNRLVAPQAVWTGKCKPCRDREMAGYDQ